MYCPVEAGRSAMVKERSDSDEDDPEDSEDTEDAVERGLCLWNT